MLYKKEQQLVYNNRRNTSLITPCCNKSNKDGKFVNFKGCGSQYGYCHSCGKSSFPPQIYFNEQGDEFIWDNVLQKFTPNVIHSQNVIQPIKKCNTKTSYIPFKYVLQCLKQLPENNLLYYLRNTFENEAVKNVIQMYYIGTNKDGGTVFWYINKDNKVQKAKVSYYNSKGKRTNKFKVPYKNDDGYKYCLYGEHLINNDKSIVLVESEKTAIVGAIVLPQYCWLSYGGINGLTEDKIKCLENRTVLIIPDMSENAVSIIEKKIPFFSKQNTTVHIWDMRNGLSDDELKDIGWYNCDLEDMIRSFI